MTWTKEDEQKIRSLILNDDIANVKIGIYLALNTLGMSIDELGRLITIDDITRVEFIHGRYIEFSITVFGKMMTCTYSEIAAYNYYLTRYADRIKELLNEI